MRSSLRAFGGVCAAVALAFTAVRAQVVAPTVLDLGAFDPAYADVERGRAVVVGAYAVRPGPGPPTLGPQEGACFQCHGIDGRGDGEAGAPRLTDQAYKYLYDSLKDYASGVRQSPVMGPIAEALTDQQMRDVSAYYAAQKIAPYPPPRARADPLLLQLGGALAAFGDAERGIQACINCHGPEGVGLPPTYPFLAGQWETYLAAQLLAWKTGRRRGDGFAIMEKIAERMSEEQINAVAHYYAALRPPFVTPENVEVGAPMVAAPAPTLPRVLGR